MLTPAKIKSHQFDASGRNAYKAESVDTFFAEVAESYEQMFRENGEMYKKIGLLAERLEEYRKDEDNIRNALLTAQRMADKITREANEKADTLLADVEERAKTENDRIDAVSNDMLQKANYQAQAIVSDAQRQAEQIINQATADSREAAISARDAMIKEEAALQMMKVEVTKFKTQIIDSYNAQLKLIEELPEIVYAKIEEEKAADEEPEEVIEEVIEEAVEVEEATEEVAEEAVEETVTETVEEAEVEETTTPDVYFTKKSNDIDVEKLQEMIEETDTAEAVEEAEEEAEEETESDGEYILPTIDEIDDEIEKLSREVAAAEAAENDEVYEEPVKEDPDTVEYSDIPFTKKSTEDKKGFKLNFDKVNVYADEDESDDDEDEFDDDGEEEEEKSSNEGGFSSKLKGFFKK